MDKQQRLRPAIGLANETPTGTTNAQVQMVVSSLNATLYVDDFALR